MTAAGIIAFFAALPAFIQLLAQIGLLIQKIVKTAETHDLNKWMSDLEATIDQLQDAKTKEEKLNAMQGIVNTIHTLNASS